MDKKANTQNLEHWQQVFAKPKGMKHLNALISGTNPQEAVQALSIPDFYFLVKDLGLGDAAPLIGLASGEQLQGCVDLEAWDGDRLVPETFHPWLAASVSQGFETLGILLRGMDPELIALFFKKTCIILDKTLGEELPDWEERHFINTPDTFFVLVLLSQEENTVRLLRQTIDYMYREDMVLARHILMSARSEMPSELEEMSFRWRSGRMADLGYLDQYEALKIFQPVAIDSIVIQDKAAPIYEVPQSDGDPNIISELPVPTLEAVFENELLRKTVSSMDDEERSLFSTSLVVVVNHVLAATGIQPGNIEAFKRACDHTTSIINLALNKLALTDTTKALQALKTIPMATLHRLGFSIVLKIRNASLAFRGMRDVLSSDDMMFLEALNQKQALYPGVLDSPPTTDVRPFRTLEDIVRCTKKLSEVALKLSLAKWFGTDVEAIANEEGMSIDLDDFLRTSWVRACIEDACHSSPLQSDHLKAFKTFVSEQSWDDALQRAMAQTELVIANKTDAATIKPLILSLLKPVFEEFKQVDVNDINPNYFTSLLTAKGDRS